MQITRRQFITQASAATIASLSVSGCRTDRFTTPPTAPTTATTLRAAGAARGLLAGCAVQIHRLRDDPAYAALVREQAAIIVDENALKFAQMQPAPTTSFFDDADHLLTFAAQNNIKVRGHNFVWHRSLPSWFDTYATPQNAEHILVDHIERVAGRYKGSIHSWDVANEVINPEDNLPNGLRNTPWLKLLGPDHIDIAFRTARKADPHALLVYNDYGIESDNPASQRKRDAVMQLLRSMKARNVPIDALGIQSHIWTGPQHATGPGLAKMIAEAHAMGLKVLLTEMDVNDRELPADIPTRDAAVAARYAGYLNTALANPAVIALLTWGITDKYTWLNNEYARADKLPQRPLPFDIDLQPTPAFSSEVAAILRAPHR